MAEYSGRVVIDNASIHAACRAELAEAQREVRQAKAQGCGRCAYDVGIPTSTTALCAGHGEALQQRLDAYEKPFCVNCGKSEPFGTEHSELYTKYAALREACGRWQNGGTKCLLCNAWWASEAGEPPNHLPRCVLSESGKEAQ